LNILYDSYTRTSEIKLDELPESFVLKATHGCGWNLICKHKSSLNQGTVKKKCEFWLSSNFYRYAREPIYKYIQPRIICERFLEDSETRSLNDYKFFCFQGIVKLIQVDVDRFKGHKRNLFDLEWNLLPIKYKYPNFSNQLDKPSKLDEMICISESLASGLDFVRVDLYEVDRQVFFGELTFSPEGGIGEFNPSIWDTKIGEYLTL
jgi:hypothetical protein